MKQGRFKITGIKLLLIGLVLGVGVFAASAYALHATDQRPFCASCHIMDTAAITQKMSTHANIACNDCHLPYNAVAKYPYKAYTGMTDVYMNFIGTPELPIQTTDYMKTVINDNCKRCHAMSNMNVASMEAKPYCVDCHRNVPHQRTQPISTRMVAYE